MLHLEMAWHVDRAMVYLVHHGPARRSSCRSLMLPSIKGAVVGLQWANHMYGFDPANRAQTRDCAS